MTILRSIALLVLAGAAPLALHANTIPAGALASTSSSSSAQSPSLYAITRVLTVSREDDLTPAATSPTSVFASVPIGDPVQSLRPFAITGETIQNVAAVTVSDVPSPTPEPAGLFLLGTGAFATALSIRYRLFSL